MSESIADAIARMPRGTVFVPNPSYQERPVSERKLAIRSILDRWVACTISVEDAESELSDIFARELNSVDIEAGNLTIKTDGLWCHGEYKLDGVDIPNWQKLSVTFEAGKRAKIAMETSVMPKAKETK